MLVSTMSIPAIDSLIQKSFVKGLEREASDIRKIFHSKKGDIAKSAERIDEIDREHFAEQKLEGQSSAQRGIATGYHKEISPKTISVSRIVSGEAYKRLEAHGLSSYASQTAEYLIDKIELDMHNFLGYGASTSYVDNGGFTVNLTVGDGKALFDATHTLKHSPLTYSNILTGAPSLSESSLDLASDYFEYNVLSNYGIPEPMTPNAIITSRKAVMVNRVARILGSLSPQSIEGTANANSGVVNVNKNKYEHRLAVSFDVDANGMTDATKSFYWFVAALNSNPAKSLQAYYYSWLSPMAAPVEVNQDKWTLSFTGRAMYNLGALSGKGICVSLATS